MTLRKIMELEEANAKLKKDMTTAVAMIEMLSLAVLKYRLFVLFSCNCNSQDKQLIAAGDRFERLANACQFASEESRQEVVAENRKKSDGECDSYDDEDESSDENAVLIDDRDEEETRNKSEPEENELNQETTENREKSNSERSKSDHLENEAESSDEVMVGDSASEHMMLHQRKRRFKCEVEGCGKKFIKKLNYHNHLLIHKGLRPFKCPVDGCDKEFKWKESIKQHVYETHETHENEKKFKCDWPGCEYRTKAKNNMEKHKKRHGEPTIACYWPGCCRMFYFHSELKKHVEVNHEQVKRFKCDWPSCDYRTSTSYLLKRHFGFHTRERKFVCSWPGCDKKYMCRDDLDTHVNVQHKNHKKRKRKK